MHPVGMNIIEAPVAGRAKLLNIGFYASSAIHITDPKLSLYLA
jgi:hypothetical protein